MEIKKHHIQDTLPGDIERSITVADGSLPPGLDLCGNVISGIVLSEDKPANSLKRESLGKYPRERNDD
jgi:hypothetical protein